MESYVDIPKNRRIRILSHRLERRISFNWELRQLQARQPVTVVCRSTVNAVHDAHALATLVQGVSTMENRG
jgi:hypothetical protein